MHFAIIYCQKPVLNFALDIVGQWQQGEYRYFTMV